MCVLCGFLQSSPQLHRPDRVSLHVALLLPAHLPRQHAHHCQCEYGYGISRSLVRRGEFVFKNYIILYYIILYYIILYYIILYYIILYYIILYYIILYYIILYYIYIYIYIFFYVVPHSISNCSWRFTYIEILKYKYTSEEKHKYTSNIIYKQLKKIKYKYNNTNY